MRIEIPLFPLPDFVLFPGVIAPMHIFESRYVELFEQVLAGENRMAVATLKPGFDPQSEYFGRPQIDERICVGEVTAHRKTDERTYLFTIVGLKRARILEELPARRSYREAIAVTRKDVYDSDDHNESQLRDRLIAGLDRGNRQSSEFAQRLGDALASLGQLTDRVAFYLPLPGDVKLALLGETHVHKRASLLAHRLESQSDAGH